MNTETHPLDRLTKRQREVLGLLAQGKSNRIIATELVIALATAENHVHAIFRKLRVSTRTEAVLVALRHGLVDLAELEHEDSENPS